MKVIKNINNNVCLCLDSQGREVVAFGRGIGFKKPPYELSLKDIQRTFYDVNSDYYGVIAQLDEKVIETSRDIVNYANAKTNGRYNSNSIFTLADHIQYALKRLSQGVEVKIPLVYEVQSLYPTEMEIGLYALRLINKRYKIRLRKDEAVSIALHFMNYKEREENISKKTQMSIIERTTLIIENTLDIKIDKKSFTYSRFCTHMYYLMDRIGEGKNLKTSNEGLFSVYKKEYPKVYECVVLIIKEFNWNLNDEEILYLILHINRICNYEVCYR